MKNNYTRILLLIIPVLISWLLWHLGLYLLYFASYALVYVFIGFCRHCRKHESIWLFILAGLSSIPMNVEISLFASTGLSNILEFNIICVLILFIFLFAAVFSLLEIIIGVIGRVIWRDQKPFIEHGFEYNESNIYALLNQDERTSASA